MTGTRRMHMDCEPDNCLVGDPSPCILFEPKSEDCKPRIDTITGTYFRKGKCAACSGSVERTRSFTSTTLAGCQSQAAAWEQAPLKHKRCE